MTSAGAIQEIHVFVRVFRVMQFLGFHLFIGGCKLRRYRGCRFARSHARISLKSSHIQ